jgi:hypothetical protein
MLLSDHLVDQAVGDLDVICGLDLQPAEEVILSDRFIHRHRRIDIAAEILRKVGGGRLDRWVGRRLFRFQLVCHG